MRGLDRHNRVRLPAFPRRDESHREYRPFGDKRFVTILSEILLEVIRSVSTLQCLTNSTGAKSTGRVPCNPLPKFPVFFASYLSGDKYP